MYQYIRRGVFRSRLRCWRWCLSLGINLDDGWAGNNIFIGEVGVAERQDHVALALNTSWNLVDLIILVRRRDACLDRCFQKTGEKYSVDWSVLGDGRVEFLCVDEAVGERHRGCACLVWILSGLKGEGWEGLEGKCNRARAAGDELGCNAIDFVLAQH